MPDKVRKNLSASTHPIGRLAPMGFVGEDTDKGLNLLNTTDSGVRIKPIMSLTLTIQ